MSDDFTICPYCREMETEIENIEGEPGMVRCGACKKEFKREEKDLNLSAQKELSSVSSPTKPFVPLLERIQNRFKDIKDYKPKGSVLTNGLMEIVKETCIKLNTDVKSDVLLCLKALEKKKITGKPLNCKGKVFVLWSDVKKIIGEKK